MTQRALTWKSRVAKALKSGAFTHQDIVRASTWRTCAIGELRRIRKSCRLPVEPDYCSIADDLGSKFCEAVDNDDPKRAAELLKSIAKLGKKTCAALKRDWGIE